MANENPGAIQVAAAHCSDGRKYLMLQFVGPCIYMDDAVIIHTLEIDTPRMARHIARLLEQGAKILEADAAASTDGAAT